jgi:hypothetical protein
MEKEQSKQATFVISGPRKPPPGEATLAATSLGWFSAPYHPSSILSC